jgi:hypothetical protein
VTKHAWPHVALPLTRWCAQRGITPNQVTALSAVLVGVAFWLFWEGHFALGLLAAWWMTLLDTVDGKLARVTLTSSPMGNIFDHGIDLIHPPFWYWAWAVGCTADDQPLLLRHRHAHARGADRLQPVAGGDSGLPGRGLDRLSESGRALRLPRG